MAEELALQHAGVEGHAVDRDEGLFLARAGVMDGAGHQFLARARLAGDEHRGAAGRGTVHHDQHIADGAAAAHDLVYAVALFHGFLQQAVLPVGAGQLRGVVDGE